VIETAALVRAVVEDIAAGTPAGEIARRFHRFVIDALFEAVRVASDRTGLRTVALSGGCFQNAVLLEGFCGRLERAGFEVLTHSAVPPNDGGIALGQAVVAGAVHGPG
jgi:hydrogenase maturation protein HypF